MFGVLTVEWAGQGYPNTVIHKTVSGVFLVRNKAELYLALAGQLPGHLGNYWVSFFYAGRNDV
jgi:hypothetical protein